MTTAIKKVTVTTKRKMTMAIIMTVMTRMAGMLIMITMTIVIMNPARTSHI